MDQPPPKSHPRDPLHGITLEMIVTQLVERHGWEELGRRLPVRCFLNNPSIKSSLTFLRKTPWARERLELMYIVERA
ncbi:MAG: VF530 family protein [Nitrospira sp.]